MMETNQIKLILDDIFLKIKNGNIERGWEVYDEFKKQLTPLIK